MSDNKRRRSRIKAGFEASIMIEGKAIPARTIDMSLKGVLLHCDREIPEGTKCSLRLGLGPGLRVTIDGSVVRSASDGLAMDFQCMDAQSFAHLLQIVRLNAPDPDLIEDELAEPAFDSEGE
ncbi:MAG: PilZ domain-containing protein [Desulfovibrionaceae bacterium]